MKLTTLETAAVTNALKEGGPHRAALQGPEFNEADYLAGALTVLHALDSADALPAIWSVLIMAGRPVLMPAEEHAARHRRREERFQAEETARRHADFHHASRRLVQQMADAGKRARALLNEEEEATG